MKIVVVLDVYLPPSETFIRTQLIELCKGNEVTVFYLRKGTTNIEEVTGCKFYNLNIEGRSLMSQWANWLLRKLVFIPHINTINLKWGRAILHSFNPDGIIIHFGITGVKYQSLFNDINKPKIVFFHGYDASFLIKHSWSYRYALKTLFKLGYRPLFVSEALKIRFEQEIKLNSAFVNNLGIDLNDFVIENKTPKENIFIQVSRFVEKKGHYYTIKAFDQYRKSYQDVDNKLWLVGDGPLEKEIKALISQLDLEKHVICTGSLPVDEVRKLLSLAKVYVQHSITANNGDMEGLPVTIMEAMAMGLPIVATNHSGIPEIVEHSINGWLCDEKDIITFAENMNKATLSDFRTSNKEKIRLFFNSQIQTQKLLEFVASFTS